MNNMPFQSQSVSGDREPVTTSEGTSSPPAAGGIVNRVQTLIGKRVVETVSVSLAVSLVLFGISSWSTWTIYKGFRDNVLKQFRLQELSKDLVHYDEALTHSANMAASTGDLKWQNRYNSFVPPLDEAIAEIIKLFPEAEADFAKTKNSTDKLLALEDQVFKLLRQGKKAEAATILFGKDYATQKDIYAQGIKGTLNKLEAAVNTKLQSYSSGLLQSVVFAGVSLPLLVLAWVIILSAIKTYIRERDQAQKGLLVSQASLRQLNEELEVRVEQRTEQLAAQEQATRQESEVLQADVGNLLDVVSAVEGGDLTLQASVSDRVTGLVADTFNRLLEQLSQVMAQVLGTAQQVTQGSLTLEELAKTVADNAQQQAQGVTQVLSLTEQVEHSAQDSAEKVNLANRSLENVRGAIAQGQEAINALTQGIGVLQQGTDRIVQQMKALGEFVGLADQFVQEQGQIASLTQVLAMNAGLVAARAAEQRDPRQFLVVAREFEAIASQVGSLAQQTNNSLGALQQRTEQIHTVVSAIDTDVQGLGGLVSEFTQGVEQSSHVFSNVRTVTGEVVQAGAAVAQSNQEIAQAAQSTATAMRGIANLATQTAQLTQDARLQSEQMETLSAQLLQRVQFFRLPEAVLTTLPTMRQIEQLDQFSPVEETLDVTTAGGTYA